MLIKLTNAPSPDINAGVPSVCYVESTRIISLCRSSIRPGSVRAVDERAALAETLWTGAHRLSDCVNKYVPDMHDPTSVGWMQEARGHAQHVLDAYRAINGTDRNQYQDRMECTDVTIAAGNAENGGMMLQRVWVIETPDEIAAMLESRFAPGVGSVTNAHTT